MKNIFNTQSLSLNTVPHFMALQANVLDSLAEDEKDFITPRSEIAIAKHLQLHMPMLGIYQGDALAAAVVVSYPDVTQKYDADNPMIKGLSLSQVAVIEGLYVHSDFRRHGLGAQLVFEASQVAVQANRTHLSAEIAVENIASYKTFLKHGFQKVAEFICPDDGCHVMSVQACAQTSYQTLGHKQKQAALGIV